MEHWEFLIQKQGDHSWRPLESPNVEITEGRYRVVACSNRANLDVDVRVTHASTLEVPPKRRIQKRSRRTNLEGLIVVIPFTYLKPGIWELRCSGDLMSDILGTSWQYSVYLQVLPVLASQEVVRWRGGEDQGDGGDKLSSSSSTDRESQKEQDEAIIDQPVRPVWLKAETVEQILKNLIELALPPSEPLLEDETMVEDSPAAIPDLPLLLTLEEETYVACWGKTLTINGHVAPKETINQVLDETSNFKRVCAGELRIELRSPLGSETLTQMRQPLPAKLLPFTIKCSIEIPSDCESKLILADISLYGALAGTLEARLLAHKSFTITADVTQLLPISAAANNSEPDTLDDPLESPVSPSSVPLNLEFFNLVKTQKKIQMRHLRPSSKKSLPPQIYPKALRKSAASLLPQLPKLSGQQTKMISVAIVSQSPTQLLRLKNDNTIAPKSRVASRGTTFPYLRRLKALPGDREEVKRNPPDVLDLETFENTQESQATEDIHEDAHEFVANDAQSQENSFAEVVVPHEDAHEFVANDAQSQENSFAEVVVPPSSELTTLDSPYISPLIRKWMHSQGHSLPEPINVQYQDDENYLIPSDETMSSELDQPLATDVAPDVITDVTDVITKLTDLTDELWLGLTDQPSVTSALNTIATSITTSPGNPFFSSHTKTPSAILAQEIVVDDTYAEAEANAFNNHPSKQQEQPVSHVSAMTEPLAIPQLHLPEGELISGNSIRVFVQLTDLRPQVAVKLWVEDCQTRWLLDGPRLLTNLQPNSLGGLEVMTHISVPFGCLEIRLEAIAVDMATQQESHKVTIQRTVIPPDLPNLPLDELLLSI